MTTKEARWMRVYVVRPPKFIGAILRLILGTKKTA